MDATTNYATALAHGTECRWHQCTHRRKDDGGIERNGRHLARAPYPYGAEVRCEALRLPVARPGEGVDLAPLPDADLGDDVCGRAETVEADPPPLARLLLIDPDQSGENRAAGPFLIAVNAT